MYSLKIRVGTRGSKLALVQTGWVVSELEKANPDIEFETVIIKTTGDKIINVSLDKIGDKGLFVKEIEMRLIDGEIDMAVHSMKDMPAKPVPGLKFTKVPKREDPRDVLVLREGLTGLSDLPEGAVIGTGSKRRKYQLLKVRPDLKIVPIRGNIDTRISKIETENLDGIVLAASGIIRAGMEDYITEYLSEDIIVPAPAQGALAIEIREDDNHMEDIINTIYDEKTQIQIDAERSYLSEIDGSCHIPMGAYCRIDGENIHLTGLFGDESGEKITVKSIEDRCENAKEAGKKLAQMILKEHNNE